MSMMSCDTASYFLIYTKYKKHIYFFLSNFSGRRKCGVLIKIWEKHYLFWLFFEKNSPYFSAFSTTKDDDQMENIFYWQKNLSLIFVKWFIFFKTINYFSSSNFSKILACIFHFSLPLVFTKIGHTATRVHQWILSKFSCRLPVVATKDCQNLNVTLLD